MPALRFIEALGLSLVAVSGLLFMGGAVTSLLQSMALGAQASGFVAHGLSFSTE